MSWAFDPANSVVVNPLDQLNLARSAVLPDVGLTGPVTFSKSIGNALLNCFSGLSYPYRKCSFAVFGEYALLMKRFLVAIDAYIESPKSRQDPHKIVRRCLLEGPSYAIYQKRLRRKSFQISYGCKNFKEPEWWDSIESIHITDIGEIFNYQYLFFWRDEDEKDYLNGELPLKVDTTNFSECLLTGLPDFTEIVQGDEVLLELSASSSFVQGRCQKNYLAKEIENNFSKSIGLAKRSVVPVHPAGSRDTVILNPSALNRVKWIDRQVREVLKSMSHHIHLSDEFEVNKRISNLSKKFKFFLHRDIKKEGITKPRELLKVTLEALKAKYPQCKAFEYTDFYDSFHLLLNDGELYYPKRGHGLGMANALTTLIQIFVTFMVMEKEEWICLEEEADFLVLNDDFVIGFNNVETLEAYWDLEDEVLEELGIIREPDKSFWTGNMMVIAERYFYNGNNTMDKTSYYIREILNAYCCYNIVHAKALISSLVYPVQPELQMKYMKEIVTYWGFEFFAEEYLYPTSMGGWFSTGIGPISFDLLELEKHGYRYEIGKAVLACQHSKIKKFHRDKRPYKTPSTNIFGVLLSKIEEKYELDFDIGRLGAIKSKYYRTEDSREGSRLWDKLLQKRKKEYLAAPKMSFLSFLQIFKSLYKDKDFFPISIMIEGFEETSIIDCEYVDWYSGVNPKMAYLYSRNNIDLPGDIAEEFTIMNLKNDRGLQPNDLRKRLKGSIGSRMIDLLGGVPFINNVFDCNKANENYINANAMCMAWHFVFGELRVPLQKKEYISEAVDKKKQIYGRFIPSKLYPILKKFKRDRSNMRKLFQVFSDDELIEFLGGYEGKIAEEVVSNPIVSRPDETKEEVSRDVITSIDDFWSWRTNKAYYSFETNPLLKDVFEEADSHVLEIDLNMTNYGLMEFQIRNRDDYEPRWQDISNPAVYRIVKNYHQFQRGSSNQRPTDVFETDDTEGIFSMFD